MYMKKMGFIFLHISVYLRIINGYKRLKKDITMSMYATKKLLEISTTAQ